MTDINSRSFEAAVLRTEIGILPCGCRNFCKLYMSRIEQAFELFWQRANVTIKRSFGNCATQRCVRFSGFPFMRIKIQRSITAILWQLTVSRAGAEQQFGKFIHAVSTGNSTGHTHDHDRGIRINRHEPPPTSERESQDCDAESLRSAFLIG